MQWVAEEGLPANIVSAEKKAKVDGEAAKDPLCFRVPEEPAEVGACKGFCLLVHTILQY